MDSAASAWTLFTEESSSDDTVDDEPRPPLRPLGDAFILRLPGDALRLAVAYIDVNDAACFECACRGGQLAVEISCGDRATVLARRQGESWAGLLSFVRARRASSLPRQRGLAMGHQIGASIDQSDGVLTTWGSVPWAQRLGLIAPSGVPRPFPPALIGGATRCCSVAIGHRHLVVATATGRVYTFGSAAHGQLGRKIVADEPGTPFLEEGTGLATRSACVEPLRTERIVAVAAGACHSLAITSTGSLYSWGHDALGQCGHHAANPTTDIESEAATASGRSAAGPFGVRHPYIRLLPTEVRIDGSGKRAPRALRIGASQAASAIVTATGLLYVAGTCGFSRAERDAAKRSAGSGLRSAPRPPRALLGKRRAAIVAVSTGANASFILAVDASGACWASGSNSHGQLGLGDRRDRSVLQRVGGRYGIVVTDVATGEAHSLAVDRSGGVWAWGDRRRAQCGDGYRGSYDADSLKPRRLVLREGGVAYRAVAVAADGSSSLCRAVQSDLGAADLEGGEESLWAWGDDGDHDEVSGLGFGAPITTVTTGETLARVQAVPRRLLA